MIKQNPMAMRYKGNVNIGAFRTPYWGVHASVLVMAGHTVPTGGRGEMNDSSGRQCLLAT